MAELLRIREDAATTTGDDGRVVLSEGHMSMGFGPLGPGLAAAMAALAAGGGDEEALVAKVREAEGEQAILKLHMLLRRLESAGWLERVLLDAAGEPVLTVRPLGHQLPSPPPPLPSAAPIVVSRFAALRASDGELLAESPRSSLSLVVHQPALAALVARLSRPTAAAQLGPQDGLDPDVARGALALLGRARIVVPAGEEETGALALWNAADLMFHTRSRVGGNVGGYGGTYRLRESVEPLPAVKLASTPAVVLERPDVEALATEDVPFTRVLEQRSSVRAHDDEHPITAAQLGHFLYRAARVRAVFEDDSQQLSSRPYPGGGAIYELELYPLVHHCDGIAAGLYHYDPQAHALGLVAEPGPGISLLLGYGQRTAVMDAPPQVLILVAARFGRAMWKYESMAYALVLKDVGVLYQTMYLVATAMGLAPCSLGGGHSDAFAATAGLDAHAETSVGEFTLGSRAPAPPDAG